MADAKDIPDSTPVLVGAGQVVRRDTTAESPLQLATEAAQAALAHAGGSKLAAAIDTVAVIRLFADSMGIPPCPFGRSDNPPLSVARGIGADPDHCIYSQVGGNEPQGRIIEFAADIARGERAVVLLSGGEAIRNQRSAERAGQALDWAESFDAERYPLEDRGWGDFFVTRQEVGNGMLAPMQFYGLIEQARAFAGGRSTAEHRELMARLLASFSAVAAANPYAQFPERLAAEQILASPRVNHLYGKRMIAQDSVNQGAALLLCSVAAARHLGIPREHWIFLHGMAEGADFNLSEREDPAGSPVAKMVLDRALAQAGRTIDDIELLDLYSCFPCAVLAVAEYLGLPVDGSRPLTLTGGLPFFGGPGNNYGTHAIAEAVTQLRDRPQSFALVSTLGGVLSKHAAGIYSNQPSVVDWAGADVVVSRAGLPCRAIAAAPQAGTVVSYLVNYRGDQPAQVLVLAETAEGSRFVATSTDPMTVAAMPELQQPGLPIRVQPGERDALHFMMG